MQSKKMQSGAEGWLTYEHGSQWGIPSVCRLLVEVLVIDAEAKGLDENLALSVFKLSDYDACAVLTRREADGN